MRRALIPSAVLFVAVATSGAAMAQTRTAAPADAPAPVASDGLRYLSWPGKPSKHALAAPSRRASVSPGPAPAALPEIAPPPSASRRRGLTPASDWLHAPAASPSPVSTPVSTPVDDPAATAAVAPPASVPGEPAADAMAPRRDAPIFRLQAQTSASDAAPTPAAPAQTASTPTAQNAPARNAPVLGARLYSVHRQAGLKPDPMPATQPVYLDGLPIEMIQPPASADLAQPDGPPALLRKSDGSVRAAPQTQEDALP